MPKHFARDFPGFFLCFHSSTAGSCGNLTCRLLVYPLVVLRGKHLTRNPNSRVNTQATKLSLQFGHDAFPLQRHRFFRFMSYLLGTRNGFLTLLLRETTSAGAHFLDPPCRLPIVLS